MKLTPLNTRIAPWHDKGLKKFAKENKMTVGEAVRSIFEEKFGAKFAYTIIDKRKKKSK